jgi:hypothetical protein
MPVFAENCVEGVYEIFEMFYRLEKMVAGMQILGMELGKWRGLKWARMRRNVEYAQGKAEEEGLALSALCGNALDVGKMFPSEAFDVVLLMGPLYHL